jgi:hypothetical protein
MKKKTSKTRFWLILVTVNILILFYPVRLLLGHNDSATSLFAFAVLMVGLILVMVVDTVSIVLDYWG